MKLIENGENESNLNSKTRTPIRNSDRAVVKRPSFTPTGINNKKSEASRLTTQNLSNINKSGFKQTGKGTINNTENINHLNLNNSVTPTTP